jgi:YgiT-type zinc finger domain-containing protein
MKCHVCGSQMRPKVTDLPFKITDSAIVIVRGLPVVQCESCREYLIEDSVMERVDTLLSATDKSAELEVVRYAA